MFDDKLDERDSPGMPSRANARSWATGIIVSVALHVAILVALLLSALHEGNIVVARRPDTLSQVASQVTLLAAPETTVVAHETARAPEPPGPLSPVQPAPAVVSSDRAPVTVEHPPTLSGASAAASANPQAMPGATTGVSSIDLAALGSDYRRRLLEHIASHRKTPPAGTQLGSVFVRFSVARGGEVTAIAISSGDPVLDRTAIDSIRNANPMPAVPPGFPDPLSVVLPIDFGRTNQAAPRS